MPYCESVTVSTPPPVPDCRDPFDRPFLELARAGNADALVTGNPGCMMQIGAGLRMQGRDTPVLHLVELLDESYRRRGLHDAAPRTLS